MATSSIGTSSSTTSMGIGLTSGINYGDLITKLIALEKKPLDNLDEKVKQQQAKQEAYGQLQTLALNAKLSLFDLASKNTFDSKTAASSDETVLKATTQASADIGSYTLDVVQLAQSSQHLSTGLTNPDQATLGAGTITLEMGGRRLDESVSLDELNGGKGVRKGKIEVIQTLASNDMVIRHFDISRAETIQDVLDILNDNDLYFQAHITTRADSSTLFGTTLFVQDDSGGNGLTFNGDAAEDLGLSSVDGLALGQQKGTQIYSVASDTNLSRINDGLGITTNASGTNDVRFYVTNAAGTSIKAVEADLSGCTTVGDVVNKLNVALANVSSGSLLATVQFTLDSSTNTIATTGTGSVSGWQDLGGSRAATDLGLVGGDGLVGGMRGMLLRNIDGGSGLRQASSQGTVKITMKDAMAFTINFANFYSGFSPRTIQDVVDIVNAQDSSRLEATLNGDGNGLLLTDKSGGTSTAFRVEDVSGDLAKQLGIETTMKVAAAQDNSDSYKLVLSSTDLYGLTAGDLVGRMVRHRYSSEAVAGHPNIGVEVVNKITGYDSSTNTLLLSSAPADTGSAATGTFDDNSGAPDMVHILGVSGTTVTGRNLEPRWVSGCTRLDDLNGGKGIARGKISVSISGTTSSSAEIDLSDSDIQTVQDLIDKIGAAVSGVAVEVDGTGDGLRIYNTTAASGTSLSVTDLDGGTMAADLGLATSSLATKNALVSSGGGDFKSLTGTADVVRLTGVPAAASAGDTYTSAGGVQLGFVKSSGGSSWWQILSGTPTAAPTTYWNAGATDSVIATAVNDKATVISTSLSGLDRDKLVGSIVRYESTAALTSGREAFGIISDYTDDRTNGIGTLSVIGTTFMDSALAVSDDMALGATLNVFYKDDYSTPEQVGTASAPAVWAPATGQGSFTLTNGTLAPYLSRGDLIGNLIVVLDGTNMGKTAMVTGIGATTGTTAVLTYYSPDELTLAGNETIGLLRYSGNLRALRNTAFNAGVAGAGYSSLTATVASGATSTTLSSSSLNGLDQRKVVGALVTVTDSLSTSSEGNWAVITAYDDATDTITFSGGFKGSTGSATGLVATAGDMVAITYAEALKGAVIRSTQSDITGLTVAATATDVNGDTMTNGFLASSLLSGSGANSSLGGSRDMLIGATITFTNTAVASASNLNEKRTIVDVVKEWNTTGRDLIILDKPLPVAPTATDTYTISFPTITATVSEVDFANNIVRTTGDMQAGLGKRSFTLCAVQDGSYQKTIQVESTDTLSDVVSKINAAGAGVKASVVNTGAASNPYKLSLISANMGTKGGVAASSTINGFSFTRTAEAKNSRVILGNAADSTVISKGTNTITDVLKGVTLQLLKAGTQKVTLSVGHDEKGILEKTQAFAKGFGEALKTVNKLTALETEVEVTDKDGNKSTQKQKGALFGDATAMNMKFSLQNMLLKKVTGVSSGQLRSLFDIGFDLDAKGEELSFTEATFTAALQSKFEQVQNLFLVTPNLSSSSSFGASSGLVASGFSLDHIRNGKTGSSGYVEGGGGTNGIKLKVGDTSKTLTANLGEIKTLYGTRLYHHFPEDTTASYNLPAFTATQGTSVSIAAVAGKDVVTNATVAAFLDTQNKERLIGSTLSVTLRDGSTKSSVITGYEHFESGTIHEDHITLSDTTISTALGLQVAGLRELDDYGYVIHSTSLGSEDNKDYLSDPEYLALAADLDTTHIKDATVSVTSLKNNTYTSRVASLDTTRTRLNLADGAISAGLAADAIAVGPDASYSVASWGTYDVITDAKGLANRNPGDLIGATVTVTISGTDHTGTITGYSSTGTINVTSAASGGDDISTAIALAGGSLDDYGYTISGSYTDLTREPIYEIDSTGATDVIIDQDSLGSVNSTEIVGAVAKVVVSGVTYASTVKSYNSTTKAVTLADKTISAALTAAGKTLKDCGYTVTKDDHLNYTISKAISTKYNPILEYRDPDTGEYKEYRRFVDLANERSYIVFPNGLRTNELRLKYQDNSGAEDFTSSTQYARLMEWEILDAQGLGAQVNRDFDAITNGQTGLFATANSSLTDVISGLTGQMTRLAERIANKEVTLTKQFANLEMIISTMNSQSSYLMSQLNAMPKAFSNS